MPPPDAPVVESYVEDSMDEDSLSSLGDYDEGAMDDTAFMSDLGSGSDVGSEGDLDTEAEDVDEGDVDGEMDVMGDSFIGPGSQSGANKRGEVESWCRSPKAIVTAQEKEITQIENMFAIKTTDAAILLRHFSWNKERLIERYMDDPDTVASAAGILTAEGSSSRISPRKDFTCEVCFLSSEDMPGGTMSTLALSCGHRFCTDCYASYLTQKIGGEGESRRVQCLQEKCALIVDENSVGLVAEPDVYERYKRLLNRTYVDDSAIMRWCPAPNCENAIECHVPAKALRTVIPTVTCECGNVFCFGCGLASHAPAICPITRLWSRKCEDDSETANWISANTKECPKCDSTIEKNGGCNHMTCKKCKHEWCWICSGPWSEHGNSWYNCNRFDEKSGQDARFDQAKSRASLARYLHYFNRFANHEQSARLDQDLYGRTEKKMEEMQLTSDLTWIEVQFLKKAVDTLSECRMTLKWTYAMAYYLEKDNMTELFEDNQRDLERAVEELSGELEKPIEKDTIPALRQRVTDLTVYVSKRRDIMLSDTSEGHREGRWKWNVSL
ncbi:hypothetical protein IE81DRAFT_226040 [Ceraceosorus guamensis]|uniref:RBR-type E3 ubiquitin transferase n=1 Tax=Ceraceosorus guamensis TaxID=1522189 RepID=A0A316WBS2_9BASI|nr:hypothetical protein IE81DRAFT_226040 [Ceraceosorus guamensis]PWN45025.1 hypothetical protein IE81DRAFT_226040 [Ceraceosorus guamensis]